MVKLDIQNGDKFGDWTVVNTNRFSKNGHIYVQCQCKCGKISDIASTALKRGKTTCCKSCARRKATTVLNKGDKYKNWTIVDGPIYNNNTAYYKAQCSCGTEELLLPLYILDPNSHFCCQKCTYKQIAENIKLKNGKVGELDKTEYTRLKRSAKARNIEFNISIDYLWNLFLKQNRTCAITGDVIDDFKKASLDRIDSSKGYVEGNLQWVTAQANLSKHVMSMDQLYEFCKKVLNHANQQPSLDSNVFEGSETNSRILTDNSEDSNGDTSAEHVYI